MTTYTHAKAAGTPTWLDLTSPNVEAARKFYNAVFGWEYDISPEFGGYTTARSGKYSTVGLVGDHPDNAGKPSFWTTYFATNQIESDVARAVALGAKIVSPAMVVGAFGSMAILADPTGATFGLWQADNHIGFEVSDEPGSATWFELYSTNAKQSRDFYTALLSATDDPMPGRMEYYVLKHGDSMLGGIMQIESAWGNMPSQWVTYFSVVNVEAAASIATSLGSHQMGGLDDSPFGRIAAMTDPNGATFKLLQPPAAR
jgi:hypothetical protein